MSSSDLTILSVTRAEDYAWSFLREMDRLAVKVDAQFIIAADGEQAETTLKARAWARAEIHRIDSGGHIDSLLPPAVAFCGGHYVLRIDDDERCSRDLAEWLAARWFVTEKHWDIARAWLWPDEIHYRSDLWPDLQTRLSIKGLAGRLNGVHGGSAYGHGRAVPIGFLEHHKLLVKDYEERLADVDRYDRIETNAGALTKHFYLPEDLPAVPLLDRTVLEMRAP